MSQLHRQIAGWRTGAALLLHPRWQKNGDGRVAAAKLGGNATDG
jgi:hypothetical protein